MWRFTPRPHAPGRGRAPVGPSAIPRGKLRTWGEGAQLTQAEAGSRYEVFHTGCPARDMVDHVTSRWGIWVLISLRSNDLRFYELRDSIQGISEKMLAQTLRALVQDGLVWREVEPTTPPRVTYGLSEFGRDVCEPLTDLFNRTTQQLPPRSPGQCGGGRPRRDPHWFRSAQAATRSRQLAMRGWHPHAPTGSVPSSSGVPDLRGP